MSVDLQPEFPTPGNPIVTTAYTTVKVKYTHYGTWQYFVSFAVSFGYRAKRTNDKNCRVVRIWLAGQLIYDVYSGLGDSNFTFYPGTEDQPFYRGQMVLFLGRVNLNPNALTVPSVTAEIVDNTDLSSIVSAVNVSRNLVPSWGIYSPDTNAIITLTEDDGALAFRSIAVRTNSEGGTTYLSYDTNIDADLPIIFAPWFNYVLGQSDDNTQTLINTLPNSTGAVSQFGDGGDAVVDYQHFPSFEFGIAQNAGQSFSYATTFFMLGSAQDDAGHWPYQVLYASNNALVYGAGVGLYWTDEPKCFALGLRQGNAIAAEAFRMPFGVPPQTSSGDVLVAFDYAVRRVRVGMAGSAPISRADALYASPPPLQPNLAGTVDDTQIYSHLSAVGKIVRLYHYNLYGDLNETDNPIVLMIETDAALHKGFVRKIAYNGTILWNSATIEFDHFTDKHHATEQTSADLTGGRLGILSFHTPGLYTVVDLATGSTETGTFTGVTVAEGEPSFWLSTKHTFYPLFTGNLCVRIDVPGVTAISLDQALADLASRAGYADDDIVITGLHDITIQGYIVGSNTTLGDILTNMQTIYQFTFAEIAGKLFINAIFDDESFVSEISIPETDLAVLAEDSAGNQQIVNSMIADDANMPQALTVTYINPEISFQQGTETVQRALSPFPTTTATKTSKFGIPVIATGAQMLSLLYRALYATWANQTSHSIRLPSKYLALIPSDGFTFSALGLDHRVTAVSVTVNADFSVSLSVSEQQPASRLPVVGSQTPVQPPKAGPVAPIRALLLDLPDTLASAEVSDQLNLGVALSAYTSAQWVSGRLDIANPPPNWATRLNSAVQTPVGTVINVNTNNISVTGPFETDYVTQITFELGTIAIADLVNATYDDMLAGANLIAIGRDSRYELLQWSNVVDNGDGTATIDTLFRGRFGTDPVIGMMAAGDYVVPYAGIKSVSYPLSDFTAHTAYVYRGVAPGENDEDAVLNVIVLNGNSRRCRAPVQLKAIRDGGDGSIDLQWRRRSRFGGGLVDEISGIPADDGRAFSIDLYKFDMTSISLRVSFTMDDDDPLDHYTFTQAQMETAGYADDADSMNVYVYQVDSAHVGRGWGGGPTARILSEDDAEPVNTNANSSRGVLQHMTAAGVINIAQAATIAGELEHITGAIVATIITTPEVTIAGELKHMTASIVGVVPIEATIAGSLENMTASGAVVQASGHRYWAFWPTWNQTAGNTAFVEMEFHESVGGSDNTSTGNAIGTVRASPGTEVPANAFDNTAGSTWVGAQNTQTPTTDYCGQDYGSGVTKTIVEISLSTGGFSGSAALEGDVKYSDDGTTWTLAWSLVAPRWVNNQTQTFSDPAQQITRGSGGHKYWAIIPTAVVSGSNPIILEAEFHETISGSDDTSDTTAVGRQRTSPGSEFPSLAFNNNAGTFDSWVGDLGITGGNICGQYYGSDTYKTIVEFNIRAGNFFAGGGITTGALSYSDDGKNWTSAIPFTAATWTSGTQVQTFS